MAVVRPLYVSPTEGLPIEAIDTDELDKVGVVNVDSAKIYESADPPTPPAGQVQLYAKSGRLYIIDDTGTILQLGTTSPTTDKVQSASGEFTVPAGVAVGDLVYITGNDTAAAADNASTATAPVAGLVVVKPTSTTATLAYTGKIGGFVGLTAGDELFLGVSGAIITVGSLPSAAGSVVQRIGVVQNATTILLQTYAPIIL